MDSPVDISPPHLKIIGEILHKNLPDGVAVWVFGSRADWTTRDSSDLDLALEGDSALDYRTMVALEMAFEESSLPYKVDIIDLNQASNSFRRIVGVQRVLLQLDETSTSNNEWKQTTIGDFAPFIYGKSLPTRKRNAAGHVPVFGPSGVIGYHDSAITDGPTIIIGRKGTIGSIHYSDVPCWPINTTFFFTDHDDELVKFKYYVLSTLGLDNVNTDGVVPELNRSVAHAQKLRVPSEYEQRSIAHILRTLDDKIELNQRMNQTLDEMSCTLFRSWFVDFDPVRAKMDGRWPQGKSIPGLPAKYYDIFPDRLVNSELGEIPEGWNLKPFDEIANFQHGLDLQKYKPTDDKRRLPVVKISQLRNGSTDGKEWAKESITPKCIINDGDVIFSWSSSLPVKVWCGGRAALNRHLFKVTSLEYPKWFFLSWLEQHLKRFQNIAAGKATTMGRIRHHHLRNAECIIPNKTFLNAVNGTFESMFTKKLLNNVQSRSLTSLRNALLPKLMSGELRVMPNVVASEGNSACS